MVEWLTTGTPRGSNRYEVQGCDVLALRDGKIAANVPTGRASSRRCPWSAEGDRYIGRDDTISR